MKQILLGLLIALGLSCNQPQTTITTCEKLLQDRRVCLDRLYYSDMLIDQANLKEQIISIDSLLMRCNCNNQDTLR